MNKKGEILVISVILTVLLVIIFLFVVIIEYFQINNVFADIKSSLFYISQNAIMAYDKTLPFDMYNVDNNRLKEIMERLLKENHITGKNKVKNIEMKEIKVILEPVVCYEHTGKYEEPVLHVVLKVEVEPVVNIIGKKSFEVHDDIKLALMKY